MNEKLRNPSWTREETILALDLYLKLNGEIPAASDPSIIELSDCLRSNPMMGKYRNRKNFRSASAVVLKLNNIRQAAEGGGLPHNSRMDREIWEQLGSRSAKTQEIAQTIRSAIRCFDLDLGAHEEDDIVFFEGEIVTGAHKRRERDPKLRKRVLAKRQESGALSCDICAASFAHLGHLFEEAAFEVHHLVPLAEQGPGKVRMSDTALLCATCHRLIHALIAARGSWLTIAEARSSLIEKAQHHLTD